MPIWSLTKERVEKLLKQVGDKEIEIDILIKLTKEDLWTRDLDDFLAEWRFQLDDEAKRQKKVANMGRRASKKLNIAGGVAGRKRKNDSDDDEFDVAPVKAKKPAAQKEVGGLLSYMMPEAKTKTSPKSKAKAPTATQKAAKKALDMISTSARGENKDDVWMNVDGSDADVPKVTKPKAAPVKAAPPTKKAEPAPRKADSEDDEEADEEIIRPTASRRPRGAATKPISYNVDDSDSDGNDMLFDVGKMVKGIDTASVPAEKSRPLFSASRSRPGSSAGLPKKSTSSKPAVDIDSDDTNYSKLAPPTTKEGPAVTARKTILSDDDDNDSLDDMIPVPPKASKPPPKASAKSAPKAKAAAPAPAKKATKAAAPPPSEPKKMPLSPAAKAYAAKKAKAEKAALEAQEMSDDDLEVMANEILDDDDEDEDAEDAGGPVGRRPARRAASAAPKKKWVISDDEDELEEESTMQFDDGDSFD